MAREDLIPFNERTEDEQKKIAKQGGIASGAARRRKRSLKEAAELFLSLPVTEPKTVKAMEKSGLDAEDIDRQMEIIVGLSKKAAKGDSKAAKLLFEILGDMKIEDTTKDTMDKLDDVLDQIGGVV